MRGIATEHHSRPAEIDRGMVGDVYMPLDAVMSVDGGVRLNVTSDEFGKQG